MIGLRIPEDRAEFENKFVEKVSEINKFKTLNEKTKICILNENKSYKWEKFIVLSYTEIEKNKDNFILSENTTSYDEKTRHKDIINVYGSFANNNINNDIVEGYNVKACPYCNTQYIYNRTKTNTTAQLDHFFPKSKYPLLAICLYNLVPSCSTCNRLKSNSDECGLSPLDESIQWNDILKFSFDIKKPNYFLEKGGVEIRFDYDESEKQCEKLKNGISQMKIDEIYNEHIDEVQDVLKTNYIYNDDKINELIKYTDLFESKEEVLSYLYGEYEMSDTFEQKPLSKLRKNIYDELIKGDAGIFKNQ